MLFTSPAFMFVFLPLSMMFCALLGKRHRRLSLVAVCTVYYFVFNIGAPINLVWLPLLTVYAYFAGQLVYLKPKKGVAVFLGLVPLVYLILMRQLAYYGADYVYPVGITLPSMCVAAYIWDIAYGERAESNFLRLWQYFCYFPVMLVGPFISYSEFSELHGSESSCITLEGCSSGIRLFAVGFIKRIAVGATLIGGYGKIFAYSWESPNLAIILLLLVLIYFGAFFSLSGYYDMAVGLSRMYGISLCAVRANPFKVATVNEYSKTLFGSARAWTGKYILSPLAVHRGKQIPRWLSVGICVICTVIFIRADYVSLSLIVPLAAFALISSFLKLDKSYKVGRTGLRAVFGVVTVLVIGAFWVFITIGALEPSLFEYLEDITSGNAEYQTDMVLISFSALKYLCVILIGLLLVIPDTDWIMRKYTRLSERRRALADYGALAAILMLFMFAVMFFLPQYPMYSYKPFEYIVI